MVHTSCIYNCNRFRSLHSSHTHHSYIVHTWQGRIQCNRCRILWHTDGSVYRHCDFHKWVLHRNHMILKINHVATHDIQHIDLNQNVVSNDHENLHTSRKMLLWYPWPGWRPSKTVQDPSTTNKAISTSTYSHHRQGSDSTIDSWYPNQCINSSYIIINDSIF